MDIQEDDKQENDMNDVHCYGDNSQPGMGLAFVLIGSVVGWVAIYYGFIGICAVVKLFL